MENEFGLPLPCESHEIGDDFDCDGREISRKELNATGRIFPVTPYFEGEGLLKYIKGLKSKESIEVSHELLFLFSGGVPDC